ncbi:MAG: hypothetical protein KF799_14600 [Bdellovibrionales bacterium]|nr:hypothetical protein [Bdellovibrionales bacterium]
MRLVLAALVLLSHMAVAQESLESLLDDAKPGDGATKAQSPNSALFYILQTLLTDPTPDQSLFIRHMEAGDWGKALIQYPVAFDKSTFEKTPNGKALFALAHFKNGMPVTGLELLFNIDQPNKIHPEIRRLWREAAPENHFAWTLAQINWSPTFSEVFPSEVEFRVLTRDLYTHTDVAELQKLFARLPSSSAERGRVGWQLVIAYSMAGKVEDAARTLTQVIKASPAPVSMDLMNMTAARLLYNRGFFAAAIKYYEKIARTSEYWPDAQEEIAWAYQRKGEPQNGIAISQSLMVPALAGQVSAESFFVHSLGQLKICDYAGVLTTLGQFPKEFKGRSERLKTIAASTDSPIVKRLLETLKNGRVTTKALGKDAQDLPRLISRDERLYRMAQSAKHLEAEAKAADATYTKTFSNTGLQGYFDKLRQNTMARARRAGADAQARVKELALQEADQIKEILRKLHIVEAEVIQQMGVTNRIAAGGAGETGSKAKDTVKFKADGELWFDEIGNYRVDVKKACRGAQKGKST